MKPAASGPTVLVAGLGALGSSVAYHLARRGARVVGIDHHTPPHTFGSSHGESRIIREAYFEDPAYVPLVRRAYEEWEALERASGVALFRKTGALILGRPAADAVRGSERSAREHGIPHRVLDTAAIRREFPEMQPIDGEVAVHEERAGILSPERCVEAHLRGAAEAGAELLYGESLREWSSVPGGGILAATSGDERRVDALVLAAGAWLPDLVPDLPLEVERQVMVWFRPPSPHRFHPDRFPVFLWDTQGGIFYGVPDLGNGLKAAQHHGGSTARTMEGLSAGTRPDDIDPVRDFLRSRIPAAEGEIALTSVCRYTNTPDGHFLVDRLPTEPDVWVASACSGHGFKFASALGAAIAGEVVTDRADPDLSRFRRRTAV